MSVASKVQAVMKEVTALAKDGKNQGQGYQFLSEEKVTTELHKACANAGLVIRPIDWEIIDTRVSQTRNGGEMHFCRVIATYSLTDADDPDQENERIVKALGEGSDTGDKVLNKCMTAAFKYALRQTFMISTGDDPDHTPSEETKGSKQQPKPAQPKPQPADSKATDTTDMQNVLKDLCKIKFGNGAASLGVYKEWLESEKIPYKKIAEYNTAELKAIIKRLEGYDPKQQAA
jgi:hypothetical protein